MDAQRKALGNDHPDVGRTLFTTGWLAFWQADYGRSLDSFSEAATILENALGLTDRLALTARTAASYLLFLTGDFAGAREGLDHALEVSETAYGPDDPLVSDALLFSGDLWFSL